MATDDKVSRRYNRNMSKKEGYSAPPAGAINQWVRDALAYSGLSQAALGRELFRRKVINNDRSIVNKMTIGRGVSAKEAFAIAEITGFPAPNETKTVIEVPLISWVSAGVMASEAIADEAIGPISVADLPPGDWIALTVKGDSMDRISPPDSVIIVNRKDKSLVSNACYVIADENGDATYKRFRAGPMRFEPVSTNTAHEPLFPDQEPFIVGRVKRSMIDM